MTRPRQRRKVSGQGPAQAQAAEVEGVGETSIAADHVKYRSAHCPRGGAGKKCNDIREQILNRNLEKILTSSLV